MTAATPPLIDEPVIAALLDYVIDKACIAWHVDHRGFTEANAVRQSLRVDPRVRRLMPAIGVARQISAEAMLGIGFDLFEALRQSLADYDASRRDPSN